MCSGTHTFALCESARPLGCPTSTSRTVYYLIKTSSSDPYFSRTLRSLGSWLQWVHGRFGLLTDDRSHENNEQLQCVVPRSAFLMVHDPHSMAARVHELEKNGSRRDINAAYLAQRDKTRLAWRTFLTARSEDWLCYLDDDLHVDVPALEQDLAALDHERALMVANRFLHNSARLNNCSLANASCLHYSQGGWCMTRPAVAALYTKHDAWKNSDDVGLGRWVAQRNVTLLDSVRWVTEYTKLFATQWPTGTGKIGLHELGYSSVHSVRSLAPLFIANHTSVLHPMSVNARALITACGAAWANELKHDAMLMWHSYLMSLRASPGVQGCGTAVLVPALASVGADARGSANPPLAVGVR